MATKKQPKQPVTAGDEDTGADQALERAQPILWSVRLREGLPLVGSTVTDQVEPMSTLAEDPQRGGWDVAVAGPSVFLVAPATAIATSPLRQSGNKNGASHALRDVAEAHDLGDPDDLLQASRLAYEVPRQACVLRWLVPADWNGADVAQAIVGRGFSAVFASPSPELLELRAARPASFRRAPEPRPAPSKVARQPKKLPPHRRVQRDDDAPRYSEEELKQMRARHRAAQRGLPMPAKPIRTDLAMPTDELGTGARGEVMR